MTEAVGTMTDLGDFDTTAGSDEGAEFELLHPTNKRPLGIFWRVLGKHSEIFRDIVRERTDARIQREASAAKFGIEDKPMTAEQIEGNAVELLTACTLGWRSETYNDKKEVVDNRPIIKIAGEELEFNLANAKRVIERFIWIREQVDAKVGELELFIKA